MLVTSNYKKNDIISIKLSTGEEVVARFDRQVHSSLDVVKPTVLTLNPQNGQVMLIPWLMSIDAHSTDPVQIKDTQIVALGKPTKAIADVYMKGSSGIAIPSSGDVAGLIKQ